MGGIPVVSCVGFGAPRLLRIGKSQIDDRFKVESILAESQFYSRYVVFDRRSEDYRLLELQKIEPHGLTEWRTRAGIARRLRHPCLLRCIEIGTLSDRVGLVVLESPPDESQPGLVRSEDVVRVGVSLLSLLALLHRVGLGFLVPLTHRAFWSRGETGLEVRAEVLSRGVSGFHREPFCASCLPDVPPELVHSVRPTRGGDLYILGALLYRLMTGHPLPSGGMDTLESMDSGLAKEIRKLLHPEPERRPTAARSFRGFTDLLRKLDGTTPPPPSFGFIEPETGNASPRMLGRSYVVPGLSSRTIEKMAKEMRDTDKLEARLTQAIWGDDVHPESEEGRWENIRRHERAGDVSKALELARKIDLPEIGEIRSRLAWRNGDWKDVERSNATSTKREHHLLKAIHLRQQGCLEAAEKALSNLSEDAPGYWLERGRLFMTAGQSEPALSALQSAVSKGHLTHHEARARAYLGLQLVRMGRLREGREEIEQALELLKDGERILVIREVRVCEAEVDLWTGRWGPARKTLSTLVSQSRSSGDTWILQKSLLSLSELEMLTGAESEAMAHIEEALRLAKGRKDLESKLEAQMLEIESLVLKREWGAVHAKAKALERRFERVPFERLRARWLLRLGRSAIECESGERTQLYIKRARDLNRMLAEPALEARLDAAYAAELLREGRAQEAVQVFNKAIEMLEGVSLPYFLAELYTEFILLCPELVPESLIQLRRRSAVRIAKELGAKHLLRAMGLIESEKTKPIIPPGFIAASSRMLGVLEQVARVAAYDVPVLLQGESGTGKELVARGIHRQSPRVNAPFVALNCAAIPDSLFEAEFFGHTRGAFTGADRVRPGLVEEANGGTLFLDEVEDLTPHGQTLLLRVLQDKEYRRLGESKVRKSDFRLITATHKPLKESVKTGKFREDLYFRLKVVEVHMPALRERRDDILPLFKHFLRTKSSELDLPEPECEQDVEKALHAYSWPGNVRELENEIVQALLLIGGGAELRLEHISATIRGEARRPALRFASQDFERRYLREALAHHGGNRTRTARTLGLTRQTLHKKLRKYGMELSVSEAV